MLSNMSLLLRQLKIMDAVIQTSKRGCFKVIQRPNMDKLIVPQSSGVVLDIPKRLEQKIKFAGPITVAEYMKEVLTNSVEGYYMKKNMFGASGDFITSPEISQIFGEMIGIWFATEWQKLGSPKPLQIVEFGPGRGSLLVDVLKVIQRLNIHKDDLSIHLVEVSPVLQKIQAERLCLSHKSNETENFYYEGESIKGSKVYWYTDFKHIPKGFSLYLAHEFFDALPIHKFKNTENGWREILIDLDPNESEKIKFRYVISREETQASKLYVPLVNQRENMKELEVCPQAFTLAQQIGSQIDEFGGIGLVVDYGDDKPSEDTFRAFKQHKQIDPLTNIGSADLTADVDFSQLKRCMSSCKVFGPVTQNHFLTSMQTDVRLKVLMDNAKEEQREALKTGYETLIDPNKMGNCFKFMAMFPSITEEHYKRFPVFGF